MLFLPLLTRPEAAIAVVIAIAGLFLASRSVAFPVGLAAMPAIVIAVLGFNPLPEGGVSLVLCAWIAIAIALELARDPHAIPARVLMVSPLGLSLALGALMLVRLGSSGNETYGLEKTELFLALNVTLMMAAILIARRPRHLDLFVALFLLTAGASVVLLFGQLLAGNAPEVLSGRFAPAPGEHPIEFGRTNADGIILAVFLLIAGRSLRSRYLAFALIPVFGIALLAAGSRGPVLALLVGLSCYVFLLRDRTSRQRLLRLWLAVIGVAMLAPLLIPGQNIQRSLSLLLGSSEGISSNGRLGLWQDSWQAFSDHAVWGLGTGGFATVRPDQLYPHNLLLEVACELGLVGLVLLVGILVLSLRSLKKAWFYRTAGERPVVALVVAFAASALVNALLSGDIQNNATLWLAIGLATGLELRVGARAIERDQEPAMELRPATSSRYSSW